MSYELLPPLSSEEFEALRASLKADGQRDVITVDENGVILDGHHRAKLLKAPKKRVLRGLTEAEKRAFVFQANMTRRNLSPDQKAEARKEMRKVANELRAENPKRNTQKVVAAMLGVSRQLISHWWEPSTISNAKVGKANKPDPPQRPDARVILPPPARAEVVRRVDAGESQASIAADYGLSQGRVSQVVNVERKKREAKKVAKKVAKAEGAFAVLCADPPWEYDYAQSDSREIENQYPTMKLEAIKAVVPAEVRPAKDAVLFLWATSPKLVEALEVLSAWGFTYKTCMVWVKDKIGPGYYARQKHELLLIGTKGKPETPAPARRPPSVIEAPRGKHSAKPAGAYDLIKRMYPDSSRVELFARGERGGWESWGFEASE